MLNNTGFELYLQGLIYRHHEQKKNHGMTETIHT
jgi:hypothetical protein